MELNKQALDLIIYKCDICEASFRTRKKVKKHLKIIHHSNDYSYVYQCRYCFKILTSLLQVLKHAKVKHRKKYYRCPYPDCDRAFVSNSVLNKHVENVHVNSARVIPYNIWKSVGDSSHTPVPWWTYRFLPEQELDIVNAFEVTQYENIRTKVISLINKHHFMKIQCSLTMKFTQSDKFGRDKKVRPFTIRSKMRRFNYSDIAEIDDYIHELCAHFEYHKDKLELSGSGWVMNYLTQLDFHVGQLDMLGACLDVNGENILRQTFGDNYRYAIQHLVDVSDNKKNDCFYSAVSAGMVYKQLADPKSLSKAQMKLLCDTNKKHFNTKNIALPFSVFSVKKFEERNANLKLAINVYAITNGTIRPVYCSKADPDLERMHLLLVLPPSNQELQQNGHYVYIKNFPAFINLIRNRIFPVNKYKSKSIHLCDLCLYHSTSQTELDVHKRFCKANTVQQITFPREKETVSFDEKSEHRKNMSAFIGFLDFEAKMLPHSNVQNYEDNDCDNCAVGGPVRYCSHSDRILHEQLPMTFSIYIISTHDNAIFFEKTYSSDTDLMPVFYETLDEIEKLTQSRLNLYKELKWSQRLDAIYKKEKLCYLCNGLFLPDHSIYGKCRDHCHMSPHIWNEAEQCWESKYLGAAHIQCNLQRQITTDLPIYVHNLMNYDSNFFMQHFAHLQTGRSLSGIPYNQQKLKTFNLDHFKFLDSYQILSASLAVLTDDLRDSNDPFNFLRISGLYQNSDQKNLLLRKSVYPYEWVRSVQQLQYTSEFPTREKFYSTIKGDTISVQDWNHGKKVYESFACKNMQEYTELYCKLDTLLLAECMWNFRTMIFDEFGLAVENYLSIPQLSFDCCLKTINDQIELMSDPTMVLMVEQSLRGGMSYVNTRHAHSHGLKPSTSKLRSRSNKRKSSKLPETEPKILKKENSPSTANSSVNKSSDIFSKSDKMTKSEPDSSILYIDANNLYGFAQKLPMPYKGYRWVQPKQFRFLDWKTMTDCQKYGYIVNCDLIFPPELHDKFDDFPLAPTHEVMTYDKLSPYSQETQKVLIGSEKKARKYGQQKLVSDVSRKNNYVVHYLNLGFYLRQGVQLGNIHSVIRFEQKDFLKDYINILSAKRALAKNDFKKNMYKLLANSLYGKFIQDVRKYSNMKISYTDRQLRRYIQSPLFESALFLGNNVHMVHMKNKEIKLNRLYAVGFSILELSKLHMYQVWYEHLKPAFQDDLELILTDTDSFIIKVSNHNELDVFKKISHIMDFSNFSKDHPFYSEVNKKVPGMFKKEHPNSKIEEVWAVKSKCYYIKFENETDTDHITCKGMAKKSAKNFPSDVFAECVLKNDVIVKSSMTNIIAKDKKIYTSIKTQAALSSFDDKRYALCKFHTVPYGSKYANYDPKKCFKCIRNKSVLKRLRRK